MKQDVITKPCMFDKFYGAGFRDLIPIIPPGAALSSETRVADAARGKAPGKRGRYGWHSYDWVRQPEPTEAEREAWSSWGASVGLRTTRFPALDVDVLDAEAAAAIEALAERKLGPAPRRVGRAPKALLLYRLADGVDPMPRRRLWFDLPGLEAPGLVELLGHGQQCVVAGNHATTGKPYEWSGPEHITDAGAGSLTDIGPEHVDAFYADLEALLEGFGATNISEEHTSSIAGDRELIDQNNLLAPSPEAVVEAVRAIPNDNAVAPTRNDYLRFGYAIKAAMRDSPGEALGAWLEWGLRWPGNERVAGNDLETLQSDWARMKPPFSVGWNYIAEHAVQAGLYVEPVEFAGNALSALDTLQVFKKASEFAGKPIPERIWTVLYKVPQGDVTLLSGDGGTGKSLLAMQLAVALASGRDWLGQPVKQSRAVYMSAEDDEAELHRRVARIASRTGVGLGDLDGLFLRSFAGEDALLAMEDGSTLKPTKLYDMIAEEAEIVRPDLIVVDTLADVFPANENDRAKARQFIGLLRRLALRYNCAVILLAHPSLDGLRSGSGMSGSTGWNNSCKCWIKIPQRCWRKIPHLFGFSGYPCM